MSFESAAILAHDGRVAAWFGAPARILGGNASEAFQVLDAQERARYAAFRFEEDRTAYLAAHVLHRQAWAQTLGIPAHEVEIRHDANGRPTVVGPNGTPYFTSLSRRRGLVAVAISQGGPVGVDVEEPAARPIEKDLLARFLEPASYASLCLEIDGDNGAFGRTWTLIEAFAKIRGEGLADSLRGISISAQGDDRYELADAHVRCSARSCSPDGAHWVSVAWQ